MADKTVRVSQDTWRKLHRHKRDDNDESLDDVVWRALTALEDDKWKVYGALADSGIAEAMGTVRQRLEVEIDEDVETTRR